MAVVVINDAVVVAFGAHGLDHTDQGDAAAGLGRFRQRNGLLEHGDCLVVFLLLLIKHREAQGSIGDEGVVTAGGDELLEGLDRLRLFVLLELQRAQGEQRGLAIRIVLLHGDDGIESLRL